MRSKLKFLTLPETKPALSMNRKTIFIASLLTFFITAALLVSGSSLLIRSIYTDSDVPLGTFIVWAGLIALPLTMYSGIKRLADPDNEMDRYFSLVFRFLILLALFWVPVSFLLAGNLHFTFSNTDSFQGGQLAMKIFWIFSYSLVISPFILLFIYGITSFLTRNKGR